MSMHEVDALIQSSVSLIQRSSLEKDRKRDVIHNLEHIPERYDFDAGGYAKSEADAEINYEDLHLYELGLAVAIEAQKAGEKGLVYGWSAFLLNFWQEYFSDIDEVERLKSVYLNPIKDIFVTFEFNDYKPMHPTLTLYKDGMNWFSDDQNELIRWFCK